MSQAEGALAEPQSQRRALIAGVGNIFFGDDAFGVEVVRRLLKAYVPDGVTVADFGVRSLHLAYELLEPLELLIVVDTLARGGEPGTLYVFEPDLGALEPGLSAVPNAHGMDLEYAFTVLRNLGGTLPRVLVVGCEPESVSEQAVLSPAVDQAIVPAAELVLRTLYREFIELRPTEAAS